MKKTKLLIMFLFIACALFMVPTIVNAAESDTFTTDSGIVVKKVTEGFSKGDIQLQLSNIALEAEGNYEWGIATSSNTTEVSKWHVLGDINASKKTSNILLTVQEDDILDILRRTDTAYLFLKNTKDNSMIINGLKLDLTLSPLYAFDYMMWLDSCYITGGTSTSVVQWGGATYDIENAYYNFEKITDDKLVDKYRQALLEVQNYLMFLP